ncbi:hypothetical protein, partial [Nocardia asteroides]
NSFGYGLGTVTSSQAYLSASHLGCHLPLQQHQLTAEALPILKTRGHGKLLEVSYAAPMLHFGSAIHPRRVRVIPGQIVWACAGQNIGITDSGVLVSIAGDGASVRAAAKVAGISLLSGGEGFYRSIYDRARDLAQARGCVGAVCMPVQIRAYGEPRPGQNHEAGPDAFFLDKAGNLVHGVARHSVDAEEWMARAIH